MLLNRQLIRIILQNQVQDLELLLDRREVLKQDLGITRVLDLDQIQQNQQVHLNRFHRKQIFDHCLDLLLLKMFLNRDLLQDHVLLLALQNHQFIHAPDQVLLSLFTQDLDQDQDRDQLV